MPTPITEEKWIGLKIGDKIVGGFKHCWTVTRRDPDPKNKKKLFARLRGFEDDGLFEWKDGEILSSTGSQIEDELNHPDAIIVTNPPAP